MSKPEQPYSSANACQPMAVITIGIFLAFRTIAKTVLISLC